MKKKKCRGVNASKHTRRTHCCLTFVVVRTVVVSCEHRRSRFCVFVRTHTQKWLAFPLLLRRRVLRIPIVITDILIHLINNKEEEEEEVVPRRRRRAALCEARRHPHPHQTRIIRTTTTTRTTTGTCHPPPHRHRERARPRPRHSAA